MKKSAIFALICATLMISACAEEGRYPVSGEECKPGDPVQDMSVPNCPTGSV